MHKNLIFLSIIALIWDKMCNFAVLCKMVARKGFDSQEQRN